MLVAGKAISYKKVCKELIGDQTLIFLLKDVFLFLQFLQRQPIIPL
jgi:hypothetical protein